MATGLAARLGQPVVIDNRPGASGTVGNAFVARAPGDGHTLLFTPNTVVISPHVLAPGAGGGVELPFVFFDGLGSAKQCGTLGGQL